MMTFTFSDNMTTVLNFSKEEALRIHNVKITPIHLLLAVLRHGNNQAYNLLLQLNLDLSSLKQRLETLARQKDIDEDLPADSVGLNAECNRLMKICMLEARQAHTDIIDTRHLLIAFLTIKNSDVYKVLQDMGITINSLHQMTDNIPGADDKNPNNGFDGFDDVEEDEEDEEDLLYPGQKNGRSTLHDTTTQKKQGKTTILNNFSTDLTQAASDGLLDPVIGREREIERLAQILCRRKKNNPILIGEPGVGKTAVVEGLALRICEHRISRSLWNKRIVVLDMASVVAGTKYRGQFEERMRSILDELRNNPDTIVFMDEIHTLVGAGNVSGSMDAANLLKPALARGEVQCIGATTMDEFRKIIEKDGALERRFQKVMIEQTTKEETLKILENLKNRYEEHHNVQYTPEALVSCVELSEHYITDRCFPDKAIDVLDEAGSRMQMRNNPVPKKIEELEKKLQVLKEKKNEAIKLQNFELAADYRDQMLELETKLEEEKKEWEQKENKTPVIVDENEIAGVVSQITGIPAKRIGLEEKVRLRNLKPNLQHSVIGQDAAIESLVRAIQRNRIGLNDPNKPIGTFLFVGPTGVGKTYLTKKLAEEIFGSEDAVVRIDMSEYMEKHTASRMVGAPPGYVGYENGGQLTEKIRRKPYSIVLLDEIEKAHTDVYNILLQVMDEGRLTDGTGNTVNFKNTIIIMTSNCGTKQIKEFGQGIGFKEGTTETSGNSQNRDIIKKALQKQFMPEFLNRLDDVIYFDQLDQEAIRKIVDIEIRPLKQRVKDMGYTLNVTDEAKELLGKKGYDKQYGVRPLKRCIQSLLSDSLCELFMNTEESMSKGCTLTVNTENENLKINVE